VRNIERIIKSMEKKQESHPLMEPIPSFMVEYFWRSQLERFNEGKPCVFPWINIFR